MTFTALEVCLAGVPLASAVVGRMEESQRIDLRVVRGDPRTTVWDRLGTCSGSRGPCGAEATNFLPACRRSFRPTAA